MFFLLYVAYTKKNYFNLLKHDFSPFFFTEKQIDLASVDLKKLKVRDLKKILSDWDEGCDGCLEKSDFIKRIEALKPKHLRQELWGQRS